MHNTKELRCRRGIDMFGEIVTRLAGMAERFCTALDCVDIGFIPDQPSTSCPPHRRSEPPGSVAST